MRHHPSPNFGPRRNGLRPDMVVLHYTAMESAEAAIRALSDPKREVSAHYLIETDGGIVQMVDEEMRAWHAGRGSWRGQDDINSRSIGIEIANNGRTPFAAAQMRAVEELLKGIMARWRVPPERIIGHSDMAPERKIDPGARFDWARLARLGLSVWPKAVPGAKPEDFHAAARAFGYPDVDADLLLSAFRLRFRPWGTGPVSGQDAARALDLAQRYSGLTQASEADMR